MLRFLCEKQNGKIVHDFVFALTQAQSYYDWRGDERFSIKYLNYPSLVGTAVANPDNYVPVGSVPFVEAYLRCFYPEAAGALRPLNVPECLFPYAGRKIVNVSSLVQVPLALPSGPLFVKSNRMIKAPTNGVAPADMDAAMFVGQQVSEVVEITSEWRVFVFRNEIQHVANYAGEPMVFPNADTIRAMVKTYASQAPVAYTLDVGVNAGRTFVIECHRFFSCGLYGFSDLLLIPKMLSQAWYEIKTKSL